MSHQTEMGFSPSHRRKVGGPQYRNGCVTPPTLALRMPGPVLIRTWTYHHKAFAVRLQSPRPFPQRGILLPVNLGGTALDPGSGNAPAHPQAA